jgi:hypothetical protein
LVNNTLLPTIKMIMRNGIIPTIFNIFLPCLKNEKDIKFFFNVNRRAKKYIRDAKEIPAVIP